MVNGTTVGLLGGAAHVYERMRDTNPEHCGVRPSDVAAALSTWRTNRPQIIVTHSVPSSVPIPALVPATGTTYGEPALSSLKEGLGYAPEHWIFGHFHPTRLVRHPAEGTTYWCLPKAERGSEALLLSGTTVQAVSLTL